jgi:hypothetical protein
MEFSAIGLLHRGQRELNWRLIIGIGLECLRYLIYLVGRRNPGYVLIE